MNNETNRLNTFNNWPSSAPVDPIRIAKAGFFYTGEGTEVQCFCCGGKISEWNYGDQVMWRHRQLEPRCDFVLNPHNSGNIPLILGRECPSVEIPSLNVSEEEPETTESSDYGLREEDEMYKSDALRLLSFVNWDDTSVTREALVSAGFYHAGQGRLRCAWCGGELAPFRNFGSLGHPVEVHRMYFPRCPYSSALHARSLSPIRAPARIVPPPPVTFDPPSPAAPASPEPNTQPQSSACAHNERVLSSGSTWRALGVVGGGARHLQYASLAARLATFEPPARWPADRAQTPRALANAGFFYTGTDDQVRCFYCDGGLGKWESGDAPWSEHARWFPHCGYVLLVKGQSFVDSCVSNNVQRCVSAESGLHRGRALVNFPVSAGAVDELMEGSAAAAALGAGLDAARVRRAITARLRATGLPFSSSDALIDAVLNDQLNEEPWGVSPQSQRLARDILAETLRDFAPRSGIIPLSDDLIERSRRSPSLSPADSGLVHASSQPNLAHVPAETSQHPESSRTEGTTQEAAPENKLTLEEENRQLKEARLCKVCMDSEVSVVFLPCGHLVSCGGCGSALAACPLCRAAVKALVRAYLA